MKPILIFVDKNDKNEITLSKSEIEKLVEDSYNKGYDEGYKEGLNRSYITWTNPNSTPQIPVTPYTCNLNEHNISTTVDTCENEQITKW
jgi:hypothetical protein